MMKVDIRDLKSPEVQTMNDDDIKEVITDGKGADVVAYIRTW
jgi:hypothetical protein